MKHKPLQTIARHGKILLAKDGYPQVYANRTQANNAALRYNGVAYQSVESRRFLVHFPVLEAQARVDEARQHGQSAFHRGLACVPAFDLNLKKLLSERPVTIGRVAGENTVALLQAWIEGWTKENLAAPVPGMSWVAGWNQANARNEKETT